MKIASHNDGDGVEREEGWALMRALDSPAIERSYGGRNLVTCAQRLDECTKWKTQWANSNPVSWEHQMLLSSDYSLSLGNRYMHPEPVIQRFC